MLVGVAVGAQGASFGIAKVAPPINPHPRAFPDPGPSCGARVGRCAAELYVSLCGGQKKYQRVSSAFCLVLLGNKTEGGGEMKGQTLPSGKSTAQAPLMCTLMRLIGVIALVS